MSIQNEITRLTSNIADCYTAVSGKGGTLPETQNSDNLAAAINSISGGGMTIENGEIKNYYADTDTVNANNFITLTPSELGTRVETITPPTWSDGSTVTNISAFYSWKCGAYMIIGVRTTNNMVFLCADNGTTRGPWINVLGLSIYNASTEYGEHVSHYDLQYNSFLELDNTHFLFCTAGQCVIFYINSTTNKLSQVRAASVTTNSYYRSLYAVSKKEFVLATLYSSYNTITIWHLKINNDWTFQWCGSVSDINLGTGTPPSNAAKYGGFIKRDNYYAFCYAISSYGNWYGKMGAFTLSDSAITWYGNRVQAGTSLGSYGLGGNPSFGSFEDSFGLMAGVVGSGANINTVQYYLNGSGQCSMVTRKLSGNVSIIGGIIRPEELKEQNNDFTFCVAGCDNSLRNPGLWSVTLAKDSTAASGDVSITLTPIFRLTTVQGWDNDAAYLSINDQWLGVGSGISTGYRSFAGYVNNQLYDPYPASTGGGSKLSTITNFNNTFNCCAKVGDTSYKFVWTQSDPKVQLCTDPTKINGVSIDTITTTTPGRLYVLSTEVV